MKCNSIRHNTALCIILLLAAIPIGINQFHNHEDAHVHHDCPVHQWESTFVAIYVLLFCLLVFLGRQPSKTPETESRIFCNPVRGLNRRAPPPAYS